MSSRNSEREGEVRSKSNRKVKIKSWKREQVLGTRLHLIETATRLFGERGFSGAPLEEVVRQAGLTRGAVYHHFKNKRDLFEAVLDQLLWDVVNQLDRRIVKRALERGAERDADAVELLVEELGEPSRHQIISVDGPAVLGRERWSALMSARLLIPLRRLVDRASEAGRVPASLAAALTQLLFAAVQEAAHSVDAEREPGRVDMDAALGWIVRKTLVSPEAS